MRTGSWSGDDRRGPAGVARPEDIPASHPLARTLADELHNFRVKVSPLGHDNYGAGGEWREGPHDDMVLAVALAAWFAENGGGSSQIFYSPQVKGFDANAGYEDLSMLGLDDDDPFAYN